MAKIPKRVLKIAKELRDGQRPRKFRVRAILKWFGASRRGSSILAEVQATLANVGLPTEPTLYQVGIDDPVRFVSLPDATSVVSRAESKDNFWSEEIAPITVAPTDDNGQNGNHLSEASDELESEQEEEEPVGK